MSRCRRGAPARTTKTSVAVSGVPGWLRASNIFCLFFAATVSGTTITVTNPSFETSIGWSDLTLGTNEFWASPGDKAYASRESGQDATKQSLGVTIEAGKTYTVEMYARSIDPRATNLLPNQLTSASYKWVTAQVQLRANDEIMSARSEMVSAPQLTGSAQQDHQLASSDDGANIWFDGQYRMHVSERFFYQSTSANPLSDPWLDGGDSFDGMAKGPIAEPVSTFPKPAIYATYYLDSGTLPSRMDLVRLSGSAPSYTWPEPIGTDAAGAIFGETVLSNAGNEKPWCIDAHVFYDAAANRLWMTWGGHALWMTELDLATGRVKDPNTGSAVPSPSFTSHATSPLPVHTRILAWQPCFTPTGYPSGAAEAPSCEWPGDAYSLNYMEGPSLYKKADDQDTVWWYACGSYGSMGSNYNIRCCRAPYNGGDARGPYFDKDGHACLDFVPSINRYGASMLLGADGDQLVPGHPHFWEEDDGVTYMGFDYRRGCVESPVAGECPDVMGIRKVEWVDGWPTVWKKITLSHTVNEGNGDVGKTLGVGFRNTGDAGSHAAFDLVSVTVRDSNGVDESNADPAPANTSSSYIVPGLILVVMVFSAYALHRWRCRSRMTLSGVTSTGNGGAVPRRDHL